MREVADHDRIRKFMQVLAHATSAEANVYLVGGATAVLMGWRSSTIDVDLALVPQHTALLQAIQRIKEELRINVELASPADFIPLASGWEARSPFITRIRALSFFHFDPYAQALAKVERGHAQDLADVSEMLGRGLVEPTKAREYFERIEPELYRFPAIDPKSFRRAVEQTFGEAPTS